MRTYSNILFKDLLQKKKKKKEIHQITNFTIGVRIRSFEVDIPENEQEDQDGPGSLT